MAIDEIAEHVVEQTCARRPATSRSTPRTSGYVEIGTPRAILVVDPIDGTRPGGRRARVVLRVGRGRAARRSDATLGDVELGVVHEIKSGRRFVARRGGECEADDRRCSLSDEHRSRRVVLDRRAARPARAAGDDRARGAHRRFVDARRLLRSRLGHVQHDADRHRSARRVRRRRPAHRRPVPRAPRPRSVPRATARCARTFPTTSRRPRSIVSEAGGVVTAARRRRSIAEHPAVGSGDGFGIAVLASASPALHERLLDAVAAGMRRLRSLARRVTTRAATAGP